MPFVRSRAYRSWGQLSLRVLRACTPVRKPVKAGYLQEIGEAAVGFGEFVHDGYLALYCKNIQKTFRREIVITSIRNPSHEIAKKIDVVIPPNKKKKKRTPRGVSLVTLHQLCLPAEYAADFLRLRFLLFELLLYCQKLRQG